MACDSRSARPRIETRLFIDGRFVDAARAGRFTTVNPATGEPLAEMSAGTEADIDHAVAAARKAFRAGVWSRLAPRQRMEVLYRFADLIDRMPSRSPSSRRSTWESRSATSLPATSRR